MTEPTSAYDIAHFERFYAKPDPWGFGRNALESEKFVLTLELAGEGPFRRALELGCGEGHFTRLLAPRCAELLAVDISSRAIERARMRCAGLPQASCQVMTLPEVFPTGQFDLVIASDILYFWRPADLLAATRQIERSLAPGGRFVALHYTLPVSAVSTGDVVHAALESHLTLGHRHGESREIGVGRPYRIDVWEQAPARRSSAPAPVDAASVR